MGTVHAKSPESSDNTIDLTSIKAKVQKINVNGINKEGTVIGIKRTKHDIIVDSITPVFDATDFQSTVYEVHKARQKLQELGCFTDVSITLDTYNGDQAHKDGLEVTFDVKENKLFGASVKTEVGNNEAVAGVTALLRNVFGRGEYFTGEYTRGTKQNSLNARFQKPLHNEHRANINVDVFKASQDAPWSSYKEVQKGGILTYSLRPFVGHNIQTNIMYESIWRNLSSQSNRTPFAIREHSGHSLKSSLVHETIVDKRDHNIFPTDGIYGKLRNEYAGLGGNIGFLKNELELQVNVPIRNVVLQGSFQAGKLLPLPSKDYGISDLFLLGGPTSIRGFERAGVGPHESGCALGDKAYYASGLHIYTPLPFLDGPLSEKFRLHGFVNTGNIGSFDFSSSDTQSVLNTLTQKMRLSYGVGLALNVFGFARFELNYCIPYIWHKGDRSSPGIQMGISTTFL